MNSAEFGGKVALVTGAGSGIGEATSRLLAARGAQVVLADQQFDSVDALSERLNAAGGRTIAVHTDVTRLESVEATVERAVQSFGALHLAVNNAGVATPHARLADVTPDEWARQISINLTGVFFSMRAQIPAMVRAGGGSIVNLASIAAVNGMPGRGAYAAAKHGVIGLTKTGALDHADQHVRVNAVAPGYVDSPLLRDRSPEERKEIIGRHPMGRMSTVEEQAELILFLLSDRASFITGACYLADGGYSAR